MDFSWFEQAAQLCIVLGFCGTAFNYIVIRPLNISIQKLGDVIAELRDDLKHNDERLTRLEGKFDKLELLALDAHKRIDALLRKETNHETS